MAINRETVGTLKGSMCSGRAAITFCGILIAFLLMSTYVRAEEADAMQSFFNRTPSQYKAYAVALGQRLLKAGKGAISLPRVPWRIPKAWINRCRWRSSGNIR